MTEVTAHTFYRYDKLVYVKRDIWLVIFDNYPVSKGHTLIVKNDLCTNLVFSDLNILSFRSLVFELMESATNNLKCDGFNIGINIGSAAGQTIEPYHIHLIPRYKGDVPDPSGGVRGVIPSKQHYQDLDPLVSEFDQLMLSLNKIRNAKLPGSEVYTKEAVVNLLASIYHDSSKEKLKESLIQEICGDKYEHNRLKEAIKEYLKD